MSPISDLVTLQLYPVGYIDAASAQQAGGPDPGCPFRAGSLGRRVACPSRKSSRLRRLIPAIRLTNETGGRSDLGEVAVSVAVMERRQAALPRDFGFKSLARTLRLSTARRATSATRGCEFGPRARQHADGRFLGRVAVPVAVCRNGCKALTNGREFGIWLRDRDSNPEPCG
jgi:hypothetical protein